MLILMLIIFLLIFLLNVNHVRLHCLQSSSNITLPQSKSLKTAGNADNLRIFTRLLPKFDSNTLLSVWLSLLSVQNDFTPAPWQFYIAGKNFTRLWFLVISFLAAILEECSFELGFCGWTSIGDKHQWKSSSNEPFVKYPGKLNIWIFYK